MLVVERRKTKIPKIRRTNRSSVGKVFGEETRKSLLLLTEKSYTAIQRLGVTECATDSFVVECLIRSGLERAKEYLSKSSAIAKEPRELPKLRHGIPKSCKIQVIISATADSLLQEMAETLEESRSEVLEMAVRGGGLAPAKKYLDKLKQEFGS